eukprot:TRINITY_DN1439_c2_g1_i1.p1 TRINITY_DN1439_c2_g1~~TRINITY_DN1439_c2_g1_i1.p1  ORF type:complete len:154 (-),score=86.36 TRINITY_DN1439_c2_g1_i1:118-579(-)
MADHIPMVTLSRPVREETVTKDINAKVNKDDIWYLVSVGDEKRVEQLLSESAELVNKPDTEGRTTLHWAADRGNATIAKMLLTNWNANVNALDSEGQTPLHYAALCGHAELVELLITFQADKTIADFEGQRPVDVSSLPSGCAAEGKLVLTGN